MTTNGTCFEEWDADLAPLATITAEVTITLDVDVTDSVYINSYATAIDDSYSTRIQNSGSITHTFTFTREELTSGAASSAGKFQVAAGLNGTGEPIANMPPFFRTLLLRIIGATFVDQATAWDIDWAYTYTRVGPAVGSIPSDDSGTLNAFLLLSLSLDYANPVPSWSAGCYPSDGASVEYNNVGTYAESFNGNVINPLPYWVGLSDDGPDIKLETLKTVAGDSINFGVTLSQDDSTDLESYWSAQNFLGTATQTISIEISTS